MVTSLSLDATSLVAFRVGLATAVLLDLWERASELEIWLTDDGVLPCDVRRRYLRNTWFTTLHCVDGTSTGQAALLLLAAVCAATLLVGRCCRLTSALVWLLTTSLHARNPLALHGGDVLLRLLLFWSMFVPLGAPPQPPVATCGSAALVLQVVLMYACAAATKSGGAWWGECSAVHDALQLDLLVTPLGETLRRWAPPPLLCAATYATLLVEWAAPLLLVCPWRTAAARGVAVAVLVPLHACFGLCLRLRLFPLVSVVALLPFVPGAVWSRTPAAARAAARRTLASRAAPTPALPSWLAAPPLLLLLPLVWQRHAPYVLGTRGAHGYAGLGGYGAWRGPALVESAAQLLFLDQVWDMFAPQPVREDVWLIAAAERADGSVVDALSGAPPEWAKPARLSERFRSAAWLQYTMNLASDAVRPQPHWELFDALSEALCRGTASVPSPSPSPSPSPPSPLLMLEIYVAREVSPTVAEWRHREPAPLPEASLLYTYWCGSGGGSGEGGRDDSEGVEPAEESAAAGAGDGVCEDGGEKQCTRAGSGSDGAMTREQELAAQSLLRSLFN